MAFPFTISPYSEPFAWFVKGLKNLCAIFFGKGLKKAREHLVRWKVVEKPVWIEIGSLRTRNKALG